MEIQKTRETYTLFDEYEEIVDDAYTPELIASLAPVSFHEENKELSFFEAIRWRQNSMEYLQNQHDWQPLSAFEDCRALYAWELLPGQRELLIDVRACVDQQSNMIFQKIYYPPNKVDYDPNLLSEELLAVLPYISMSGFVARFQDAKRFQHADEMIDGLRLDYPDRNGGPGPFMKTTTQKVGHVFALRFRAQEAEMETGIYRIPYGARNEAEAKEIWEPHGVIPCATGEAPFTGTGFTASPAWAVPEFKIVSAVDLALEPAELYLLTEHEPERLVAVYNGMEWLFAMKNEGVSA